MSKHKDGATRNTVRPLGVVKVTMPATLKDDLQTYWKLWIASGDPRALLAWSQKIGEENDG